MYGQLTSRSFSKLRGTIFSANVWLARTVTFVEVAGVVSDGNYPIRSEMYF